MGQKARFGESVLYYYYYYHYSLSHTHTHAHCKSPSCALCYFAGKKMHNSKSSLSVLSLKKKATKNAKPEK